MRGFCSGFVAVCWISAGRAVDPEAYDYVIVGGGLAGSVLANRLSASGRHSVLLLNVAGAPDTRTYSSPIVLSDEAIIGRNLSATDGLNVRIEQPGYEPVPHFSTSLTGSSPARQLGGSSLVSLAVYLRDHPEVLDAWGEGWSWEELRPYFHRAEGLTGTPTALAESDYGQKGPYTVRWLPAFTHNLTYEFIRAAQAAGLPWAPDLNTERGVGVGLTPTAQRLDGSKVNAYEAYLAPALGRRNLVIRHGARADRLLIRDHICHGVVFRSLAEGSDHVVHARKEVILSSGYIYSPRLLFLSGLGAKEDLEAVGLDVVKDLPAVGRHLTAARFTPLAWRTSVPTLSQMMGSPISPAGSTPVPEAYGSSVMEATARARSAAATRADPTAKRPDIVLNFMPLFYAPRSAPLPYSLQGESWPLQTNAFTIMATIGETKAKGTVTFPAGAPDVSPVVTHEAMTDPEDLARAQEAVELARRLGGSSTFVQPTEAVEDSAGGAGTWTAIYDGRGTCRMGRNREDSVVDSKLRVHGITKLRVVDGSVIPVGSPYLGVPEVLAVAERAVDLILEDHGEHGRHSATEAAAAAPTGTVTVAGLREVLGESFTLMQGVAYLAGSQNEILPQLPRAGSTTPRGAVLLAASVAGLAAVAAALHVGKAQRGTSDYAALPA